MQKSTKWFLVISGILFVVGLWLTMFFLILLPSIFDSRSDEIHGSGERVAVISLEGPILSSAETVRLFKKYRDDHRVKAILLRVESPGGGVVASQEIYEEVRKTRLSGLPVVVSMGAMAASGGYYVSCAADRIVANPGTLTGSIGVISQFMRIDSLLHRIGIEATTIKSGKLKDAGNPFRQMTQDDRSYFQDLMDQIHRQFIDVVARERDIDRDSLLTYADGRVFTGEAAMAIGLIDTIGTFEDAVEIAGLLGDIEGPPAHVKERERRPSLFERLLGETRIADFLSLKDEFLNQPILQYRLIQSF